MNRRDALIATLSAAVIVPALRASAATQAIATPSVTSVDPAKYPKAWDLQRSTLVVDGLDPSALNEKYLEMLKAGGVNCWHQSVGGLDFFATLLTFLDKHSDKIVQAATVRDIRQAKEQGKIAHLAGWQMADPLIMDANGAGPVQNLRAYRQLGLRIASIAYNNSNIFGGGCLDPDVPLTRLGKKYVEAVHNHRIVLDVCGHTGERTSFDAIQVSKGVPIICSHTNARALNDNPRRRSHRPRPGLHDRTERSGCHGNGSRALAGGRLQRLALVHGERLRNDRRAAQGDAGPAGPRLERGGRAQGARRELAARVRESMGWLRCRS